MTLQEAFCKKVLHETDFIQTFEAAYLFNDLYKCLHSFIHLQNKERIHMLPSKIDQIKLSRETGS